jgi:hypothetical protein
MTHDFFCEQCMCPAAGVVRLLSSIVGNSLTVILLVYLCNLASVLRHPPTGLGKTLTTISFLHTFFTYNRKGRALLVVPSNVSAGVTPGTLRSCSVHGTQPAAITIQSASSHLKSPAL